MGATSYFPDYDASLADDGIAKIKGSSFGKPDGTVHDVEVLEGNGSLIVRVTLQGHNETVDLLFDNRQADAFCAGVEAVLRRIGIGRN